MINIHPEHWADSNLEWWKIWVVRKVKNFGKRILIRSRARRGNFIERICGRRY